MLNTHLLGLNLFNDVRHSNKTYSLDCEFYLLEEYLDIYLEEHCFREDVYQSMRKRAYQLLLDNMNGVETKTI